MISDKNEVVVLSIFPDDERVQDADDILKKCYGKLNNLPIVGASATELLESGEALRQAISGASSNVRLGGDLPERSQFSEKVEKAINIHDYSSRYLVLSPSIVPLDLALNKSGMCLGDAHIFSHLLIGNARPTETLLSRVLSPIRLPLSSYLLLCPMAMDRQVPRQSQDIVIAALSLERHMPVELWLQPTLTRAKQAFEMENVSWLHIDTHGDNNGRFMMLGPSRGSREIVNANNLPEAIGVPLIIVIGCALNACSTSIGMELFKRGAHAVWGFCAIFQSLGITNSEEDEMKWYRTLLLLLLQGEDIGTSLLEARRTTKGGLLKYAWITVGSSFLSFESLKEA